MTLTENDLARLEGFVANLRAALREGYVNVSVGAQRAADDLDMLLGAVRERDGLIHDLQQDAAAYALGVQAERARVTALLTRARDRHLAEAGRLRRAGGYASAPLEERAAGALADVLGADPAGSEPPVPPDRARAENARLRSVVARALRDFDGNAPAWAACAAAMRSTLLGAGIENYEDV